MKCTCKTHQPHVEKWRERGREREGERERVRERERERLEVAAKRTTRGEEIVDDEAKRWESRFRLEHTLSHKLTHTPSISLAHTHSLSLSLSHKHTHSLIFPYLMSRYNLYVCIRQTHIH